MLPLTHSAAARTSVHSVPSPERISSGVQAARGAARDFRVPEDMRIPALLRPNAITKRVPGPTPGVYPDRMELSQLETPKSSSASRRAALDEQS